MRLLLAIWFLKICSALDCMSVVRPLNKTVFKNIISEGKWHVMFRYKSAYNKSLDLLIDTGLYTEFEFLDVFPYECRIEQRCTDRNFTRSVSIRAKVILHSFVNFEVYRNDYEKYPSVKRYDYTVHKYEPNRLLILYSCKPYILNHPMKYGLLVLHKVDTKGLRREIEMESVLAGLQLDLINANETTQVSLNEDLECPQQFLDWYLERNEVVANPRGNWRFALANFVMCKVLLQIYMD